MYLKRYFLIENSKLQKNMILLKKQKIKMHFSSRVQSDKILNGPLGDALGVVPSKNHNGFRLAAHEGYGLFRPAVL